jgi:hypothetical protein
METLKLNIFPDLSLLMTKIMYKPIIKKSPAYYLGMESNLEIMDKTGKVIYKRYAKVNMYVTDPTYSYEALVKY